jgi:hypothetical protein
VAVFICPAADLGKPTGPSNSPDPAVREAVQKDLANILHPIVQHKMLETKQMVVMRGEGRRRRLSYTELDPRRPIYGW